MPDFMQTWWFMGLMCFLLVFILALIPLAIVLIVRNNSRKPGTTSRERRER